MALTRNKRKAGAVRVLLRQSVIGTGGDVWHAGQEYAAPADLARQLVGRGAAERVESVSTSPKPKAKPNPLDGVDFASDQAAELAMAARLTAADFDGIDPSGSTGYTKSDVAAILELLKGD